MLSLLHSVPWVHVPPAVLAVVVAFLYLKTKWIYPKVVFGVLWLLLLPNTAYIFTDVERITLHWSAANMVMRIAFVIQYIALEIIGLVTYLLAMLPFESMIQSWHFPKKAQLVAIILLNFLVGFGMVLGRTGYTNSYVVFTQPTKVLLTVMNIVTSLNLLALVALFGTLCSYIYVLFRSTLLRRTKRLLHGMDTIR